MKKVIFLLLGALIVGSGSIYAQDKPLVRYDEEAFEKVAKKVDQKKYNDMVAWGEKVFQEYFKHKGIKVDFTESDYENAIQAHDTCAKSFNNLLKEKTKILDEKTRIEAERVVLEATKESLEAEKESLISERDALKTAKESLETQKEALIVERDALKAAKESMETEKKSLISERDALKGERDNLKASQGKLEEVFTKAQTAINGIYEANKNKSFADMNQEDLNGDKIIYDGLKVLVEYHPLDKDTKDKLDIINAWSQLKTALNEAVDYMKGKYNNNKRTTCIANINNASKGVNLTGKQLNEKENVLSALQEQATVNAKFNELLNYLINDFVVIPSKTDASDALNLIEGKAIKNYDGSTKQIVVAPNQTYHKKHVDAIRELQGMMQQAATKGPTKTLQIEGDFRSAMEKIRNEYQ